MAVGTTAADEGCGSAAARRSEDDTVHIHLVAFNAVAGQRTRSNRLAKVIAGFTVCAAAVVAIALLSTEGQRTVELQSATLASNEGAQQFRHDAEKALQLQASKDRYDAAKGRVKQLHEELEGLEHGLAKQLKSMDRARSSLVEQIQDAEGVPHPATPPATPPATAASSYTPPRVVPARHPAHRHDEAAAPPPLPDREPSTQDAHPAVASPAAGKPGQEGASSATTSEAGQEGAISDDVMKDLKGLVHQHLQNVEASVTAANTLRDAAYAAEHALGFTQRAAARVADLTKQSEEQAGRVVEAARLSGEAREAMRAALEQSSQIVDYNAHAAKAVAQDAGFVATGAQAVAGFLHSMFEDKQQVHREAAAASKQMDSDVAAVARSKASVQHMTHQVQKLLAEARAAKKTAVHNERLSKHAATRAAAAAGKAVDGEQQSMEDAMKSVSFARIASKAAAGAESVETSAENMERSAEYMERSAEYAASEAAYDAAHIRNSPLAFASSSQPQPLVRGGREGPQGYMPLTAADPYVGYTNGYGYYDRGYGYHGRSASPLKDAKELVDTVLVLMQHMTHALEAAGGDCVAVQQVASDYESEMAAYHTEGAAIASSLSAEDMGLVEEYANVQVQSFAEDMQRAIDDARAWCGISLAPYQQRPAYTPALPAYAPLPPLPAYAPRPFAQPPLCVACGQQGLARAPPGGVALREGGLVSAQPLGGGGAGGGAPVAVRALSEQWPQQTGQTQAGAALQGSVGEGEGAPVGGEEVAHLREELASAEAREQHVKGELAQAEAS